METTVIDMGLVRGIATVLALAAFLAVVVWAYGKRSQEAFSKAAQLPLEEDDGSEMRS